jgi:hypothetical protein
MDVLAVAEELMLRLYQVGHTCEEDLQAKIASALTSSSVPFEREVNLTPTDRIDFLVGKVGIEVKVKGSPTEVARQLNRYVQSDRIESLLLVTSKATHRALPSELNGKQIRLLYLNPLAAF